MFETQVNAPIIPAQKPPNKAATIVALAVITVPHIGSILATALAASTVAFGDGVACANIRSTKVKERPIYPRK